jgi:hypothetical protein
MKHNTEIARVIRGWVIVYYLDNGFPIPAHSVIYPFKWMARLKKWWVENVHGNYVKK